MGRLALGIEASSTTIGKLGLGINASSAKVNDDTIASQPMFLMAANPFDVNWGIKWGNIGTITQLAHCIGQCMGIQSDGQVGSRLKTIGIGYFQILADRMPQA